MIKKFIAIAFLGTLVLASCSKKESTYEKDSNIMLQEPETTVSDSAVTTTPVDVTATTATGESATVKVDSAAIK